MPIHFNLFEMILFELNRYYGATQPYLNITYRALFSIAYYGLMCIGELTASQHSLKAKDMHIASNKNKILVILHSSKMHGKESLPQKIKISDKCHLKMKKRFFCPFSAVRTYLDICGSYISDTEQLFVLTDKSPITADMARNILRKLLINVNLDPAVYSFHSFRIGRAGDLLKAGKSVEEIKRIGRWKSNAVYKYFKL